MPGWGDEVSTDSGWGESGDSGSKKTNWGESSDSGPKKTNWGESGGGGTKRTNWGESGGNGPKRTNWGESGGGGTKRSNRDESGGSGAKRTNWGESGGNNGPKRTNWGESGGGGAKRGNWGESGGSGAKRTNWGESGGNNGPKKSNWGESDSSGPEKSNWGESGSSGPKKSSWGESSDSGPEKSNWGESSSSGPKKTNWGESGDSGQEKSSWGESGDSGPKKTNWGDQNGDQDGRRPREGNPNSNDDTERPAPYKPEEINMDEEVRLQGEGAGENFRRYQDQKVTCLPVDAVLPIQKFDEIISSEVLMTNIKSQKYSDMTSIQKWAIPAIMDGHDIIGCAQTGSGKTAAFLLPILQTILKMDREPVDLNSDCQNPYCLIISPTRELANQIYMHACMLARDSIIKCLCIYGQVSTAHLKSRLSQGCDVLVATPGRLKDFVQRGWIGFKNIKYIVLDEGDRLVDEGFTTDIRSFFNHESMPPQEKRQTLFFSATFKQSTQLNAKEYLRENFIFLSVGRVGAANEDIRQEFMVVPRSEKKRELKKLLEGLPENEKTIIFTQTKQAADFLASFFTSLNLSSTSIHGDRHQSQREEAIRAFRRGQRRFLISSPVGNRGLDLPQVALVINYDLPSEIDEYVHRIGRTGRAGHTGRAISFVDQERDSELIPSLIEILTEAKQEIPDWMTGGGYGAAAPAGDKDSAPSGQETTSWGAAATETTTTTKEEEEW